MKMGTHSRTTFILSFPFLCLFFLHLSTAMPRRMSARSAHCAAATSDDPPSPRAALRVALGDREPRVRVDDAAEHVRRVPAPRVRACAVAVVVVSRGARARYARAVEPTRDARRQVECLRAGRPRAMRPERAQARARARRRVNRRAAHATRPSTSEFERGRHGQRGPSACAEPKGAVLGRSDRSDEHNKVTQNFSAE